MKSNLTQERVRELFDYDPVTGVVTRLLRTAQITRIGDIVGCRQISRGKLYLTVMIDCKRYRLHRIIWLYMTGSFPKEDTDHVNGNGCDNRWLNLRSVTRLENMKNSRKYSNNTSGVTGVVWYKSRYKWLAQMRLNGVQKCLGYFDDIEDAIKARQAAEITYNFHVNHGSDRPL